MKKLPLCTLAVAVILASPAVGMASKIRSDRFGPDAVFESFEGQWARHNVGQPLQNVLIPGTKERFSFASGVTLGGPMPNNPDIMGGVRLINYGLLTEPWRGFAIVGLGEHGTIDSGDDIAFGLSHLLLTGRSGVDSLEFLFDEDMARVGASVTSLPGDIQMSAYDAEGDLLEVVKLPAVRLADWGGNFLGIERPEGIRSVRFSGSALILDGLRFEPKPVPEPSAILLWSCIAGAGSLVAMRRRQRNGVASAP